MRSEFIADTVTELRNSVLEYIEKALSKFDIAEIEICFVQGGGTEYRWRGRPVLIVSPPEFKFDDGKLYVSFKIMDLTGEVQK